MDSNLELNLVAHFWKVVRAWNRKTSPNPSQNLQKSSLGASGRGLGCLGQALERLNRVLDASWGRLGGFWKRPEANLRHLGGFLGRVGGILGLSLGVLGGLGRVLGMSRRHLEWFFGGLGGVRVRRFDFNAIFTHVY